MNEKEKAYLKNWLVKAEHDLLTTQKLVEDKEPLTDIICFHCQQAIEKYLKAFLIFNDREVEKTHDINGLIEEAGDIDKIFNTIDLKDLNWYAVKVRYPDEFYMPPLEDAKDYINIAQAVKDLAESKIKL